ncbi:hypothetical protein OI71_21715 [Aeromonas hydrophila]|uniref:DUF2513 domain-containing protein n=1 Tax=Aeromonas hydrophila TaxID=644 RepID=UPI00054214BB|nr:DUF2513 domain-containing protein [Aeromonas hydrophila]KHE13032.1 hypothetical protein OI71_21715 [Aeromonas hydrophila]
MKLNIDYLSGMLKVFLNSERPFITLEDLATAGYSIENHDTLFHYLLLVEEGYISTMKLDKGNPEKLGVYFNYRDGTVDWSDVPIRLTNSGLEFAESLNSKDVFERLKQIGDQPMSVFKDVGLELLKSYAKKKFGLE